MVNFLYSTPAQRRVLYELLCLPVRKQRPARYPNQSFYVPQKVFSQQDFFECPPTGFGDLGRDFRCKMLSDVALYWHFLNQKACFRLFLVLT